MLGKYVLPDGLNVGVLVFIVVGDSLGEPVERMKVRLGETEGMTVPFKVDGVGANELKFASESVE